MDNPFKEIKEWHIWLVTVLVALNIIGLFVLIAKGASWLWNHIQFI